MVFLPPRIPVQELLIAAAIFVAVHAPTLRPFLFFGGALLLSFALLWLAVEE